MAVIPLSKEPKADSSKLQDKDTLLDGKCIQVKWILHRGFHRLKINQNFEEFRIWWTWHIKISCWF